MNEILNYTLIETGKHNIRVSNIIGLVLLTIATALIIYLLKRIIYRTQKIDVAKKYALFQLTKYFIVVIAIVIGLEILSFNISILLAGSAALLVGLGLGIQNLFSDFVSGIVILIDGTIKVNDIIEVNGIVCKVQEINIRTTTVLTRDDKYIIIPNTDYTQKHIINWTHSDISSRFEITVGVDYSSDIHTVMKIMENVAREQQYVLKNPKPFVRFNDYADSSLIFTVYFWSDEVFRVENIKSEMRIKIFDAFKASNVTIPFPQRVVHIQNK